MALKCVAWAERRHDHSRVSFPGAVSLKIGVLMLTARSPGAKGDDFQAGGPLYRSLWLVSIFRPQRAGAGEATLGSYLSRDYWGRGLASEASRTFIGFGFSQLDLRRIVATVEVGNAVSIRVLEKLGFAVIGSERGVRSFYHFELLNRLSEANRSR